MWLRHVEGQSEPMTTTDEIGGYAPPPTPPPPPPNPLPPQRVLRRSRTDRVGAGVAGGLGEYFAVDPVLFRVLFATAAFFGGAGVLAYLLAWAAIPEQGTVNAPIDRFIAELRRRRVPVWLVAIVAGLVLWGVAFSWWAPGRFFPVVAVVIVLVVIFGRRGRAAQDYPPPGGPDDAATRPVNLEKGAPADAAADGAAAQRPAWVDDTRQWIVEAKQASRLRRHRAMPVRLATVGVLVVTLGILAAVDAARGIALPSYFWAMLIIVGAGLLVGIVLRRTPWTLATLLIPTVVGLVAFGGSRASLHDGTGQREWAPTTVSALQSDYHLAFGQVVLDLRHLGALDSARSIDIRLGAGQVRILAPSTMNLTVDANVHIGDVTVDGSDFTGDSGVRARGFNVNRTILPPAGATGVPLTMTVHLTDGNISVEHTS